jgi:hypothetical protein
LYAEVLSPLNEAQKRNKFTKEANKILTAWVDSNLDNPYPDDQQKLALMEKCDISLSQLNNWFGNHRSRLKRKRGVSLSEGDKPTDP